MWNNFLKKAYLAVFLTMSCALLSCQSASLEAPGSEKGKANVEDFNIEKNIKVAFYMESDLADKSKSPELTYGSMDAYFVTLDGVEYMVDWNDLDDYKALKKGENITFRATGRLARIEQTGKNVRVIVLNEM